jgi:hypothetical protein
MVQSQSTSTKTLPDGTLETVMESSGVDANGARFTQRVVTRRARDGTVSEQRSSTTF